jgi:thioester reductase-like protein
MNVFLTGSSGFLGGELLVSLSKREDISKIYCLIRAKSLDDGISRLAKVFELHNDFFDRDKIIPVIGDLTDVELATKLINNNSITNINLIIHSAANTSFSRIYDDLVERVNINGLRYILEWAKTLNQLETFAYIGTATICGGGEFDKIIYEHESPNPNAKHLVKYTYTKMVGETMLPQYLPAEKILVLRPSIVMGDSRPWIPRSPVILWALATVNLLRLIPLRAHAQLDIVPVDYAINAISELIFSSKRHYSVYHISAGTQSYTTPTQLTGAIESYFPNKPSFKFIDPELLPQMKKYAKDKVMLKPDMELFKHPQYLSYWKNVLGENGKMRIIFAGLEPYLKFIDLGQIFDNSRLLEDTHIGVSQPAHEYVKKSIKYLEKIDIFEGALDP